MPNTSNDDDTRYRSREEVEEWRARDPLQRLRKHLLQGRQVTEAELESLESSISHEVAEATAEADAQPDASPEEVLLHTWADQPVAALPWMTAG
jgi:TPP-dependent pyruvate/acetoin dehydrogenase alpha subunit